MAKQHVFAILLLGGLTLAPGCSTTQVTRAEERDPGIASAAKAEQPMEAVVKLSGPGAEAADAVTTAAAGRDARAEEIVRALASQAKARKAFRFKFVDEFDDIQGDGRKIQITHLREGVLSRPNRFKIETTGDVANRTLFEDGKTVTLWDRDENIYAQIADPGSIDQTLDTLMDRYHTAVPAADLFYADPGKALLGQMTASEYVGLSSVDGTPCHHLAFTGTRCDWQVWVAAGDAPALRKLVIDYKTQPGRPQYVLRILSMEPLTDVDAAEFQFTVPAGAERVEMQPASGK